MLNNAIIFTNMGGSVSFETTHHADGGSVFRIIDTGIGNAPKDLDKAMAQFGRSAAPSTAGMKAPGSACP